MEWYCYMSNLELVVADLDGCLAESKMPLDSEMASIIAKLLKKHSFAVISGGKFQQFQDQFLKNLNIESSLLTKLFLFPTCGSAFYRYINNIWTKIYSEDLTSLEKQKIFEAFEHCFDMVGYIRPEKKHIRLYGEILEDRETQITFSALGQHAPYTMKKDWDPNHLKRLDMINILQNLIPEFEIRTGGSTSIDITRKNIDKAYGIYKIQEHLTIPVENMIFIGDALFPGGNDFPVKSTGIKTLETSGPEETKIILKGLL